MSGNRRVIALAVLFAALGIYYMSTRVLDGGQTIGVSSQGTRTVGAGDSVEPLAVLATSQLERKPGVYRQGRDLFSYGQAPRPQPRPRQPPPPPAPRDPQQKPITAPAAEPPAIDMAYLGSFGYPGRRIAVFSDAAAVYNARVGDIIKEKFILVSIGYESVDLKFVGFPDASPRRLAAGGLR